MSESDGSAITNVLFAGAFVVLILGAIVLFIPYLLISLSVASTAVEFLPQPGIGIVQTAFKLYAIIVVIFMILGYILQLLEYVEEHGAAGGAAALVVLLPVSLSVVLLFHYAATTLWQLTPDIYALKTSIAFVNATALGGIAGNSFPDDLN